MQSYNKYLEWKKKQQEHMSDNANIQMNRPIELSYSPQQYNKKSTPIVGCSFLLERLSVDLKMFDRQTFVYD